MVLLPFFLLPSNLVKSPSGLGLGFFISLPFLLCNFAQLLLENLEDAKLNGDTHQRNGAGKAQLYLHLLRYRKLDAIVDKLWEKGGKAEVPDVKLRLGVRRGLGEECDKNYLFHACSRETIDTQHERSSTDEGRGYEQDVVMNRDGHKLLGRKGRQRAYLWYRAKRKSNNTAAYTKFFFELKVR